MGIGLGFSASYPRALQIQTVTGCNATCVMCPTGVSEDRKIRHLMPLELWQKIIDECSSWDRPLDTLLVSLFNEPLLDRRLLDLVDSAKGRLPLTRLYMVTNGSLLTDARVERILASRLDIIQISVNARTANSFDLLESSLDFDRIVAGTQKLLEGNRGRRLSIVVSMVEMQYNTQEVQQFTEYWQDLGAIVHVSPAWNRAGNLPAQNDYQLERLQRQERICPKPFFTMCITAGGDVVLCCADYGHEVILGNTSDRPLADIWMGPQHTEVIVRMMKDENALCNRCDKLYAFQTHNQPIPLVE